MEQSNTFGRSVISVKSKASIVSVEELKLSSVESMESLDKVSVLSNSLNPRISANLIDSNEDLVESEILCHTQLKERNSENSIENTKSLHRNLSKSETDVLANLDDIIESASYNNVAANEQSERVSYIIKNNLGSKMRRTYSGIFSMSNISHAQNDEIFVTNCKDFHCEIVPWHSKENISSITASGSKYKEILEKLESRFASVNSDETILVEANAECKDKMFANQMENIAPHDESIDGMKAVVCKVLRTWSERPGKDTKNYNTYGAHCTGMHGKKFINVREYVKEIEKSIEISTSEQNSQKELYANILHTVLNGNDSIEIVEIQQETRQLLDETIDEENWKKKFNDILLMFQEFANNTTKSSSKKATPSHNCFTYLNGPVQLRNFDREEDITLSLLTQMNKNVSIKKCNVTEVGTMCDICDRKSVAVQTDGICQASYCCQVSVWHFELASGEAQINENTSTYDDDDDILQMLQARENDEFVINEDKTRECEKSSSTIRELNTDGSGLSLTKVSTSQMELIDHCLISAPCERDFHTIHIEAVSSPPSSIMHRQPLCTRFWNVVTDFCIAACFCIQVNKDCIFCMALFVIFVMSTSLLTAFFYRTLNADSRLLQQHRMTAVHGSSIQTY